MPVRTSVGPGDIVGGKYSIEKLLGEGGMGLVFVAHHAKLNRRVAIKCLKPSISQNADAAIRLEREARAVAGLESDHVTKVLDVGQLRDGAPYVVMELLEGQDLASVLKQGTAVPLEWAIHVMLEVCDAVAEAHALGIVHRDLKPANIFLHRRVKGGTTTKVLDFGISKVDDGDGSGITEPSQIMGSPRYMSPEQLRNAKEVTASTDIWSLGATLYELITGTPPFRGESITKLCTQIFKGEPIPPRTLRSEVPPALEDAVLRCLRKNPEERFRSVDAFADVLRECALASSQPTASRPAAPSDPGRVWRAQSNPEIHPLALTTAMPSAVPAPLQAAPTGSGTLHGVDAPPGQAEGRIETSRLRWGLSFMAVVLLGGVGIGAAALLASPEPSLANARPPSPMPPPVAAGPPPLPPSTGAGASVPPPSAPSENVDPEPLPAPSAGEKRSRHHAPPPPPSASTAAPSASTAAPSASAPPPPADPLDLPFAK